MGQQPLELPMSPCAPSSLNLVESEPRYSVHTEGLKKRKTSLLEELKFKALSPVMEVNQSDNSASDYMHRHHHHQGSVSSISSASPSLSEGFQPRPTAHISPPVAWESYCTETPELRPFSQPMEVCEYDPWMTAPHHTTQPTHISPVTATQFGSPLHSTEISGPSMRAADEYPPSEQEKPLFLEFNTDEYEDQEMFGERMININPQETPCMRPHDFSESHTRDYSSDFEPQENKTHMHPAETTPTTGSQYCSSEMSTTRRVLSFSQKVMLNHSGREKASNAQGGLKSLRRASCGLDCEEDQFVPSCLQTEAERVGIREKTSSRMRDMGTQTAAASTSARQDASVQCSLLKAENRLSVSTEHTAPFHQHSTRKSRKVPSSTTRRHTGKSNEGLLSVTQCTLSEIHKVKWNTPWNTAMNKEATQQAPGTITGQESSPKSENQACTNTEHPIPGQNCSQEKAPAEPKEKLSGNIVVRGERCEGHEEESVNPKPAENACSTEEHGRERGVNWVSGEAESLQEIADILLMLKQKNKPE
ncbi:uncharacterized protein LOC111192953 isoform X1 [Astyanax mexicanus]|uniref:uncharacterized protein LOC111192953 isoform X1 n=1 Tax=Astyanax mexicanus TaxID=7994 RepID=UPI0020CB20BA|nr:uncharacterized protein LOC111192953 isoform X1 [Astyanax mexicanus]